MDFRQYHDLEDYLFRIVRTSFARQRYLSAFDFFCIVIWKANRAKGKIAGKLMKNPKGRHNLKKAVHALTDSIARQKSCRDRLRCLCKEWKLSLSMASTILTVLYPKDFTIYDERVCDTLGEFHDLKNRTNFESIWCGYEQFKRRVEEFAPQQLSLRDKDRYLWGKSFYDDLTKDIKRCFNQKRKGSKR